jgi:hypothetical protein
MGSKLLFTFVILPAMTLGLFVSCGKDDSPSGTSNPTPTFTPTATFTATPTKTPADLNVTGSVTIYGCAFGYPYDCECDPPPVYMNIHIFPGGTLYTGYGVTINSINGLTLDSGGSINGVGKGYPVNSCNPYCSNCCTAGIDCGPGTPLNICCAGAGHGGPGGADISYHAGGPINDTPLNPRYMGSGSSPFGASGGDLFVLNSPNGIVALNGSILMDGYSGSGGAGGTIYIKADQITGSGYLSASGADGIGGGGGGIILLSAHTSNNFSGTYSVNGGLGCGVSPCTGGGIGAFNITTF